ncbi:translation initiation factor IF-2-like [Malaclemys terrapin pileata]|uniref:translation initiation factor IF-2-like n=1 Tax=Malaclemys terrapin pileata TaxID=2991368 RepID=UPI0023A7D103|nr:translation initiation factor IF-2-like [Malaclemys terrapin pileata]
MQRSPGGCSSRRAELCPAAPELRAQPPSRRGGRLCPPREARAGIGPHGGAGGWSSGAARRGEPRRAGGGSERRGWERQPSRLQAGAGRINPGQQRQRPGGSLRSGHRGLCEAPSALSLPGRRERRGAGPAPHGLHAAGGAGGGQGEPPPAPSPVARSPGAAPGSARDHAAGRAPGAAGELGHHERTRGADAPLRPLRETPDSEEAARSMPGRCWCFCSARGL